MIGRYYGATEFFKDHSITSWQEFGLMLGALIVLVSVYVYFFGWNWPDMGSMK